jgi:hypothetical protein
VTYLAGQTEFEFLPKAWDLLCHSPSYITTVSTRIFAMRHSHLSGILHATQGIEILIMIKGLVSLGGGVMLVYLYGVLNNLVRVRGWVLTP